MFRTILIAVDLGALDDAKGLLEAAREVASDGAVFHVVNVIPDMGSALVGSALGPDHSKDMLHEAKSLLEKWATSALPEARLHVVQGTIYDKILRTADAIDADVIIVGAHRPELRDYLVGPNAARVVRHATQSVIVIR